MKQLVQGVCLGGILGCVRDYYVGNMLGGFYGKHKGETEETYTWGKKQESPKIPSNSIVVLNGLFSDQGVRKSPEFSANRIQLLR